MAEPLKATFFAFQRHSRGGVLLSATVVYLALAFLLIAAFVGVNWGAFSQIAQLFRTAGASQQQAAAEMSGVASIFALFGWAIIFLFFFYVLLAAYEAACLRWMIRGEVRGFLGFSLGADTWRVYSGYWLWALINFGISFAISAVTMPFVMAGMMNSAAHGGDAQSFMGTFWLISGIRILLQYGAIAFVGVRFAPGNAVSITRQKFAYFDAWKVTKGRFWALLGSFLVIWLIWFAVSAVIFAVAAGALLVRVLPLFLQIAAAPPGSDQAKAALAALFAPEYLGAVGVFYLVVIVTSLALNVLFMGVNARAALAAVDEGKIDGLTTGVAKTFE